MTTKKLGSEPDKKVNVWSLGICMRLDGDLLSAY